MKLRRFLKSLINSFLFFINAILWIFNIDSIGELATKIQVGKGRKEKFMYGMFSLLQYFSYGCIIGLVYTIYWWYKGETSIAEKLSGLKMEKISSTVNNANTNPSTESTITPSPMSNDPNTPNNPNVGTSTDSTPPSDSSENSNPFQG